jgi:hypothetical protein
MGRIIVTEFLSLDGVMEAPGGGEDFEHAGWTFEIARGEEGDKFKLDEALDADALLLGRMTASPSSSTSRWDVKAGARRRRPARHGDTHSWASTRQAESSHG